MFDKSYIYFELGYNEQGIKYKQDGLFYNSGFEEVDENGEVIIHASKDLIVSASSGAPFKTKRAAQSTIKKKELEETFQIIEYHGGYALERKL